MAPADRAGGGARRAQLIYPTRADPRWFQMGFLSCYVAFALLSPGFSRSPLQWLAGMSTCLAVDAALLYFYKGLLLVPVSGLISSLGLLLLCDSPSVWPYAVVGALSILSKHFIRVEGRHIFNPLNFGVVAGLLFLSGDMTVVAGRWGGSLWVMLAIAAFGALTVYRASRLDVASAYVLTFLAGVFLRAAVGGGKALVLAGPMTGASFQLFTFFMLSDPMTTPETPRGRWLFGIALGALDTALRYKQVSYAPFYALFVMAGFLPLLRAAFRPSRPERVWKTAARPV